ncbi:hypothetical protein RNJ44_03240 [Nakaseomyces bracarensis]|uniref:Uncharacterized protein n=1 Tax=Nakaseomyces bracarensis TaxID=273131 RepID=A0ABR4NZ73_9SACH
MKITSIAALALSAVAVNAELNATPKQLAELNAVLQDLKSNFNDYINLATNPSSGFSLADMPAGLIELGMAIGTATDDSYTSLYTGVDFAGVDKMVTMVPWYSSRLLPLIDQLYTISSSAAPATSSAPAAEPSAAPASSAAPAPASSAAPAPAPASSSALAPSSYIPGPLSNTTSALPANGTTTQTTTHLSTATETVCDEECHKSKEAQSTATAYTNDTQTAYTTYCPESSAFTNGTVTKTNLETTTSTVCETCTESKVAPTTAKPVESKPVESKPAESKPVESKPAENQTTMTTSTVKVSVTSVKPSVQPAPSASSSPAIEHQTANGAAKAVAGMGAGVLAAAALLL